MKSLKKPTANQKGLKKLPKAVRNKMGYAKDGMKYKKGGKLKGANKVTGAKSTQYSKKESAEYWDGAKMSAAALSGRRGANILRKEGLGGTPQKPSPAMGGAKHVADMLGENTDNIPRRKLTVRELQTAGAKKKLKGRTSGKSGNVGSGIKLDPKKKRRRR